MRWTKQSKRETSLDARADGYDLMIENLLCRLKVSPAIDTAWALQVQI